MDLHPNQQHILSLCSGGGGLDLGVRLALPAARTVGYVEIEAYACHILVSHMEARELDAAPLWTDLRTFDSRAWRGCVDGIIGGYPCQPFSIAGKQRGADDPRHLWPFIKQHLGVIRPRWCFFENVANHLKVGFADVARDLHSLGYCVAASLFTAEEVGAIHKRERLFIMAYANGAERRPIGDGSSCLGEGLNGHRQAEEELGNPKRELHDGRGYTGPRGWREPPDASHAVGHTESLGCGKGRTPSTIQCGWDTTPKPSSVVGDAYYTRLERWRRHRLPGTDKLPPWPPSPEDDAAWSAILATYPELAPAIESKVRRVAHGMAPRIDRLRLLGNGVVPEQAAYAFRSLATDLGVEWGGVGLARRLESGRARCAGTKGDGGRDSLLSSKN